MQHDFSCYCGKHGETVLCQKELSVEEVGNRQNAVKLNGAMGNARQSSAMHSECYYKRSTTERGSRIHHRERERESADGIAITWGEY